jgi:hypothetical protein
VFFELQGVRFRTKGLAPGEEGERFPEATRTLNPKPLRGVVLLLRLLISTGLAAVLAKWASGPVEDEVFF